jgi:hypothetical protein
MLAAARWRHVAPVCAGFVTTVQAGCLQENGGAVSDLPASYGLPYVCQTQWISDCPAGYTCNSKGFRVCDNVTQCSPCGVHTIN